MSPIVIKRNHGIPSVADVAGKMMKGSVIMLNEMEWPGIQKEWEKDFNVFFKAAMRTYLIAKGLLKDDKHVRTDR